MLKRFYDLKWYNRVTIGIAIGIALALLVMGLRIATADVTPMLGWGDVVIDGENAPIGTQVEVYIGDDLTPSGSRDVTTAGRYGAIVVSGSDARYGDPLTYKVNGVIAQKLGPDPGVFGLENQVVDLAVATTTEKTWSLLMGCVPRHLPDVYHGSVDVSGLEDIPTDVQGVYKFDDALGLWLFFAPGAPGCTLDILEGGRYADYMVCSTGICDWIIPLH